MTVPVNSRRREYAGNGITTIFNGPMAYMKSHITVFLLVANVATLVPSNAYTVERYGIESGTRVTMNVAPASGSMLLILRTVPYQQDTDISNQGAFNAETIEKGFDNLAMQIQQLADGSLQLILENGEFVWDAKGSRIVRVGDAVGLTDAVNLRYLLNAIEQIQEGGGAGVDPLTFDFEGDGVETDFFMEGADVGDARLYDTYVERAGQQPDVDFTVELADDNSGAWLRFVSPPDDGAVIFTVLRGYARPYIGPTPITSLAMKVRMLAGTSDMLSNSDQYGLIGTTSSSDILLTIREGTGIPADWKQGETFSVVQLSTGQVTVAMEDAGELVLPSGFEAKTRGQGSIISFTCLDADTNTWVASGDLFRTVQNTDVICLPIYNMAELIGTNIVAGTSKATIVMPFGMVLQSIGSHGLYCSLAVAQAAGSLFTVDVNRNGASILATKMTLDNGEKTSRTAAVPAVYATNGNILYAGDEITVDVDQVGTALAKGLVVYLVGARA